MQTLKELLEQSPYYQPQSPQEALEAFNHISLTEDETAEALLMAKMKKEHRMKEAERRQRNDEMRRQFTAGNFSPEQVESLIKWRLKTLGIDFVLDDHNTPVYNLLLLYFAKHPTFTDEAEKIGIANPLLKKGILLCGNPGTGKTWLLQAFKRNQRQCYDVLNAKQIVATSREDIPDHLVLPTINPLDDPDKFYQPLCGICIDDIGTEDIVNHYGNRRNVIGDLIELRYNAGSCGDLLHATTNLTAAQLNEFYGPRVTSRMREIFNLIELPGIDRRK